MLLLTEAERHDPQVLKNILALHDIDVVGSPLDEKSASVDLLAMHAV